MYLLREFVISLCNGKCDSEVTYTNKWSVVVSLGLLFLLFLLTRLNDPRNTDKM